MCVEALELAIKKYGVPEIMHTDRGKQFMGRRFQGILEEAGVRISVGKKDTKTIYLLNAYFEATSGNVYI